MLVCYPYTPANRSDVLALARTHFMYLASADSLHPSSINHTDAHTSSPDTSTPSPRLSLSHFWDTFRAEPANKGL